MPAHLPANRYGRLIADMEPGESGYTVPWAMTVNMDGECYLNLRYTVHRVPGGTVQIRVYRSEPGYCVTLPRDYRYTPSAGLPWMGAQPDDVAPVLEIVE